MSPKVILIVDDVPENLRLLASMLITRGYEIRKSINGKMALRSVETDPPDLILLDIMLPDLSGYQVCEVIRSSPTHSNTPIIFMSALDGTFDKVRAFQAGGTDYVTKPFAVEEVIARIENQLRVQDLQRQLQEQNQRLEAEIQERKLIEAELRRSEYNYHTLACHIPDGAAYLFDAQLNFIVAEGSSSTVIFQTPERTADRWGFQDLLPELHSAYRLTLMGEPIDMEFCRNDHTYLLKTVPLKRPLGTIYGGIALVQNITALKQAQKEIELNLQREQELNQIRSRFVSILSHEFRTPLATIQSAIDLIQHYNLSEEKKAKRFQQIENAIEHMIKLFDSALFHETIYNDNLQKQFQFLNPKTFLEELVSQVKLDSPQPFPQEANIRFHYENLPEQLWLEPTLTQQILTNLIANSLKYSSTTPQVEILLSCDPQQTALSISVKDHGIGIPQENQAHLFELFSRGSNTEGIRGQGLGLAVVHKSVEILGGTISFQSTEGLGTEFQVTLPLHQPSVLLEDQAIFLENRIHLRQLEQVA